MKKAICFFITLILLINSASSQISDFLSDVSTRKILIEGDYLYFYDYNSFTLENEVKRVNLNTPLPSIEILFSDIPLAPAGIAKNDNFLYVNSYNVISNEERIYKINIDDPSEPEELLTTFFDPGGVDIAYNANFIYVDNSNDEIRRMNTLSTPPIAISTLEEIDGIDIFCYYIDVFTLYIGTYDGEIYTRNLIVDAPAELLHTIDATPIRDITIFEGDLYYCDSTGVHRFNPLDVVPEIQTLATSEDFISWPEDLSAKLLDSGERYLYVSDWLQKIIKIDLNDPTLSIKNTTKNNSSVFPNPALNKVTIKSNYNIEKISVYDILGKEIQVVSPTNYLKAHNLDIADLKSGSYFLKIITSKGIETKKIIKH